jgi:hypothetical protein
MSAPCAILVRAQKRVCLVTLECYRVECKIEALEAIVDSIVIECNEILIELQWPVAIEEIFEQIELEFNHDEFIRSNSNTVYYSI